MTPERGDHKAQATNGMEFDAALRDAEGLLASADSNRHAAARQVTVTALTVTASVVVVAAVCAAGVGWAGAVLLVIAVAAADLALVATVARTAISPMRQAALRDERYAIETVSILRELLPVLSHDEQWSLFRAEQARLRMSRFGITARRQR